MKDVPVMEVRLAGECPERTLYVPVRSGETISRAIWLSGMVEPVALCSGLGRCGLCRVRFLEMEHAPAPTVEDCCVLGQTAVDAGWRLGCRHTACAGMVLEVPGRAARMVQPIPETDKAESALLAVDLGTTSLQWTLIRPSGMQISHGQCLNPQLGAGSDVMSRISAALDPDVRVLLRERILQVLRQIVQAAPAPVSSLCVAGNTAMTAILLNREPSGLAGAPYQVPDSGGRFVALPGLPPAFIPPQPAPFIGGDIAAGVAALLAADTPLPFLLADMGTNGEVALVLDGQTIMACSVPLGPAIEGIGLRHGVLAGHGAIVEFVLSPLGLEPRFYAGEQPQADHVTGITGTGYLSLITQLLRCGALDVYGHPVRDVRSPLAARVLKGIQYSEAAPWQLSLPFGMVLTAEDVEALLKVRAAFVLAVHTLVTAADRQLKAAGGIASWVLAGALGEHVSRQSLETLGFVPQGLGPVLVCAGNTSLRGALCMLLESELRQKQYSWTVLDVTASDTFAEEYMHAMRFDSWSAGWSHQEQGELI